MKYYFINEEQIRSVICIDIKNITFNQLNIIILAI